MIKLLGVLIFGAISVEALWYGQRRLSFGSPLGRRAGFSRRRHEKLHAGYGNWESCPEDEFVFGMQLKVDSFQANKDNTALNGVRFFCRKPGERPRYDHNITSKVGNLGVWGTVAECDLESFFYLIEPFSDEESVDDRGLVNLFAACAKHPTSTATKWAYGDGPVPTNPHTIYDTCPDQRGPNYVVGLRTFVQDNQGDAVDDVALYDIRFECQKPKLPTFY